MTALVALCWVLGTTGHVALRGEISSVQHIAIRSRVGTSSRDWGDLTQGDGSSKHPKLVDTAHKAIRNVVLTNVWEMQVRSDLFVFDTASN
jgi:hypothetical protein